MNSLVFWGGRGGGGGLEVSGYILCDKVSARDTKVCAATFHLIFGSQRSVLCHRKNFCGGGKRSFAIRRLIFSFCKVM